MYMYGMYGVHTIHPRVRNLVEYDFVHTYEIVQKYLLSYLS